MKKLDKDQEKARDDLVAQLRIADAEIEKALVAVNEAIGALNTKIEAYNEVLADVEAWRDEITSDMQTHYDDRSEKWQESDAGQAFAQWQSDWEAIDVDAIAPIDEIETIETAHADELEQAASDIA